MNKLQLKFVKIEGNANKQYRAFTLEKLSGFMNTSQIQKKFLQSGEKQGKYMLKPSKARNVVNDGSKNKKKKKHAIENGIRSDFHDYKNSRAIEV